jgi:hypothetical protein
MKRRAYLAFMYLFALLFILFIVFASQSRAENRQWFSFMMDRTTCIEIQAVDFMHAQCALEIVAKDEGYKLAEVLEDGCPGMLAENYYYDFTFKNCLD